MGKRMSQACHSERGVSPTEESGSASGGTAPAGRGGISRASGAGSFAGAKPDSSSLPRVTPQNDNSGAFVTTNPDMSGHRGRNHEKFTTRNNHLVRGMNELRGKQAFKFDAIRCNSMRIVSKTM